MTTGDYSGPCCCGSVTRLKGGIHPDAIRSATADIYMPTGGGSNSFNNTPLVNEPGHLVSVTAGLFATARNTVLGNENKQIVMPVDSRTAGWFANVPIGFSLFTLPSFSNSDMTKGGFAAATTYEDGRTYLVTGAVSVQQPNWTLPEDCYGLFFDGALFLELNAPSDQYALRVTTNFVPRAQFSPAYPDPVDVLQHYWNCAHANEEFLEGFYGGIAFDVNSSAVISGSIPPARSSFNTVPGSPPGSYHTTL